MWQVDALKRYLETQQNLRALDELATWGEGHARALGFKESDVERGISDFGAPGGDTRHLGSEHPHLRIPISGYATSNF